MPVTGRQLRQPLGALDRNNHHPPPAPSHKCWEPTFPPPPPCMEWTKEDPSWTALIWGGVGGIVPWGNGATLNSTILCSSDPSWLFSGAYPMPKSHCCWLWFQGVCVMLPCKLGRPVWPEKGPRPPTEPVAAAAGRCFKARSPTQGTCLRSQNP